MYLLTFTLFPTYFYFKFLHIEWMSLESKTTWNPINFYCRPMGGKTLRHFKNILFWERLISNTWVQYVRKKSWPGVQLLTSKTMGPILTIYGLGLKCTAKVHSGRVRIHFCYSLMTGKWSKQVAPILLMSNGYFLGVKCNKPIRVLSHL